MSEIKCCNICNQDKSISDFYKSMAKCKLCYCAIVRAKKAKIREDALHDKMKTCLRCEIEKHISQFEQKRNICVPCSKLSYKETREHAKQKYKNKADTITKKCVSCSKDLNGSMFPYGRQSCKECISNNGLESNHPPPPDAPPKKCIKCEDIKCATLFRYQTNICRECEKERLYKWREENPEKFSEICKRYREKPDYSSKQSNYKRNRYNTNILYKTQKLYRNRLRMAIHGTLKNREEYIEFLGCSYERLMDWLEYNFHGEMDWNNMGSLWHVDHILPCSSFDFSIKQDIHTCFHWSNLAPALAKDNLSKSNKIIPELIEFFRDRSDEFSKLYQTKDSQ